MTASVSPAGIRHNHEQKRVDRGALQMMLSYVESECRRLGALDAARHTAMAAALLPEALDGAMGSSSSLQ